MDTTLEELQPPTPEGPMQQVRPWVRGGLRGTDFAANKMKKPTAPEDPTEQEQWGEVARLQSFSVDHHNSSGLQKGKWAGAKPGG